jgi:hypothetical protein
MKKTAREPHALEWQMARFEAIAGLRRALDNSYGRVRETACRRWQRYFARKIDPSDACVTVRIKAVERERRVLPTAAVLRVHQRTVQKANRTFTRPRFAA